VDNPVTKILGVWFHIPEYARNVPDRQLQPALGNLTSSLAAGPSASEPLGAWMSCWPLMSPQANPSHSRPRCSPAWSKRSTGPQALPRMRRCATGAGGRTGWRSRTRYFPRSCGHASGTSLKCRGPATQKNPDAIAEFQATCGEPLQRVIPPEHGRPVRVFSQDESRRGL
jgi:hypothetical protein